MIIRNFGVRHGRQALAAPFSQVCRALSSSAPRTTTTTTTTTTTETITAEPSAAQDDSALRYRRMTTYQQYQAAKEAARKAELAKIPPNWYEYQHQRDATHKVGSFVETRYHPYQYLDNPPHDVTLEMLMAAQTHMGHHTSLWNPANSRYIYGVRAGIHIISLETTAEHLRRAARVVEEVAYYGGLILFVGTRKGMRPAVVRAAELAKGCHLFQKWTPGAITNRDVILANRQLQVVDERDRPLQGFDEHIRDCRPIIPDLVVCFNPKENYTLLHECGLENIPTIGVIDTDADPTWVTYQIPANDDSIRSITLIAGVLGRAGERGQRRRLNEAEQGLVTWRNPGPVERYINISAQLKARKEAEEILKAHKLGELQKQASEESYMTDDELLERMFDPASIREAPVEDRLTPEEEE